MNERSDNGSSRPAESTDKYMNDPMRKIHEAIARVEQNIKETGDEHRLSPTDRLVAAEPLVASLALELADGMDAERWDVILAEGVSSRIPALAIRGIMKKHGLATGKNYPSLHFVSPIRKRTKDQYDPYLDIYTEVVTEPSNQEILNNYIARHAHALSARALLLTDQIFSGVSIDMVGSALAANDIPYDIAVLLGEQYDKRYPRQFESDDVELFAGDRVAGLDSLRHSMYALREAKPRLRDAIGVEKNESNALPRAVRTNQADIASLRREIYGSTQHEGLTDRVYNKVAREKDFPPSDVT